MPTNFHTRKKKFIQPEQRHFASLRPKRVCDVRSENQDTQSRIQIDQHTTRFMLSPPKVVDRGLKMWRWRTDDVFLEIGCGQGQVLAKALACVVEAMLWEAGSEGAIPSEGSVASEAEPSFLPTLLGVEVCPDLCRQADNEMRKSMEKQSTYFQKEYRRIMTRREMEHNFTPELRDFLKWKILHGRFENVIAEKVDAANSNSANSAIDKIPLTEVTKVYFFLDSGMTEIISPILNRYLPVGAQIISCDFPLDESSTARIKLQWKLTIHDVDVFGYQVVEPQEHCDELCVL